MWYLERLAEIARAHGHRAWVDGETACVAIPYSMRDGSSGEDVFECGTLDRLREVLGY